MTSDLLDVEEAAAFLHVKVATVRSWVLKSKVSYVKLGRRIFLRRQDLQEFINKSVVPASGGPRIGQTHATDERIAHYGADRH